tara:strand:- start:1669 stop:1938 length:270 start_codon:yes stop_codon:yes gene_type:complete
MTKKTLNGALLARIAEQTDANQHTGARLTLTRALGHPALEAQYVGIVERHARAGELMPLDSAIRNALDNELFNNAARTYKNYTQIMEVF